MEGTTILLLGLLGVGGYVAYQKVTQSSAQTAAAQQAAAVAAAQAGASPWGGIAAAAVAALPGAVEGFAKGIGGGDSYYDDADSYGGGTGNPSSDIDYSGKGAM
jgi:hypothetical protein